MLSYVRQGTVARAAHRRNGMNNLLYARYVTSVAVRSRVLDDTYEQLMPHIAG